MAALNTTISSIMYSYNTVTLEASVVGNSISAPTNVIIPSSITISGVSYSVTSINNEAFRSCYNLINVTIPSTVNRIGGFAFFDCRYLISITMNSASIKRIEEQAFNNCYSLLNFTIPSSVTSIDDYGLYCCRGLTNLNIPSSVTFIGKYGLSSCSGLRSLSIPSSVKKIDEGAFWSSTGLTSIIIPSSVTSIGTNAFQDCQALTTIYLSSPNGLIPAQSSPANNVTNFYGKPTVNIRLPTASVLFSSGLTISQIINGYGMTLTQLYDNGEGLTVQQLYYNGNGYTISQLMNGLNLTILQLYNAGLTVLQLYNGGVTVPELYSAGIPQSAILVSNICFPAGTPISVDQGIIPIELLDPEVHTIRNKKIVGITKTITTDKSLICFEKDSLGPNIPSQKTSITKNHELLYKGQMIKAKDFVDKFENVKKIKYTGEVLYNVLMEEHYKMVVNNMVCETLNPENAVAQLYKILQTLTLKEQKDLIKAYNTSVAKHKIFSSNKLTK